MYAYCSTAAYSTLECLLNLSGLSDYHVMTRAFPLLELEVSSQCVFSSTSFLGFKTPHVRTPNSYLTRRRASGNCRARDQTIDKKHHESSNCPWNGTCFIRSLIEGEACCKPRTWTSAMHTHRQVLNTTQIILDLCASINRVIILRTR